MAKIQETSLPGVGMRHEFTTQSGDHLGVITHRSGRRDLLVFDRADPDACGVVVRLEEDDSDALAELLGASQVTQGVAKLRQEVGGLVIDWLPINPSWSCSGCPIEETGLQQQTGVSIVAVVRAGETIPAPDSSFRLQPGDMAVVVGSPDAIGQAIALLQKGEAAKKAVVPERR
ncbi:MAG: TrkA domain protein [Abditibacteriota bacterium]|nr:TrkA domain protein [Abditibacteriota bacterium]